MKDFGRVIFKIIIPSLLIVNCSLLIFPGCGDLDNTVTSLTVDPMTATVGVSQSKLFSVVAKNSSGNIVSGVTPTWSVTGSIGTVGTTGIFTAGTASGEGTVVATYNTLTSSSTVTITDKGWIAGIVSNNLGGRVANINLSLTQNPALFTLSNNNGTYTISSVPAGTYEVAVTDPLGIYQPTSAEVSVVSGGTTSKNFTILYYTNPPDTGTPSFEITI